jgi:hypothetical protein
MDERPVGSLVADPMVDDYLRRLDLAARVLPDDRRQELVDEIATHIAQSGVSGQMGEAHLRTLLDRLGAPSEIVAAAREGDDSIETAPAGPVRRSVRPSIGIEITAVLLLTAGSLLPFVGWIAGLVLLWMSRRWRTGEKILATLVFPGGPGLAVTAGVFGIGTSSCSSTGSAAGDEVMHCTGSGIWSTMALPVFVVWLAAPIVVSIVLLVRARDRAAAEPPTEAGVPSEADSTWGGLEITAAILLIGGAFLVPIVGPVAGVVCAWSSGAWTKEEKWIATALTAISAMIGASFLLAAYAVGGLFVVLGPMAILAPAGAGIYLVLRLSSRRR